MQVDPRGAMRAEARTRSARALTAALGLGLLIVVAAATAGPIRLSGPRWLVHISSGHARPPQTRAAPGAKAPTSSSGFPVWIVGVVAGIAAAALLVWILVHLYGWWANRRSRAARSPAPAPAFVAPVSVRAAEPVPDAPAVRSGIQHALDVLGEQREPADAVVRAWLGLQETAEQSGIPRRPAETPTEFTTRIVRRTVADDRPVATLLRLYLRTRFGDHPVSADDVAAVREALGELVATWSPRRSAAR